ncbi:hypothetical protein [Lacrimispora xylanisolvens]|uniref:hypothetical protein n=1 Tax=Lacrimispora xylanisolvens TaxID=384636 RepID=UPI002402CC9E
MMKFALPYNGDMDFIDQSLYMYGNYIESYFGNLGIDDFGGGRAQTQNIVKQENELKAILDKLNAAGIDFNYVINNNGLMNEEFTEKYQERYLRFINKLVDLGIRKVTLSNPYLIQYTKQKLPDLKISASVNLKNPFMGRT